MTITLPDAMRDTLEKRAAAAGFATVDEYVADLVTDDLPEFVDRGEPDFRTRAEFEKLVEEGLASGPSIPGDAAFWARMEGRVRARECQPHIVLGAGGAAEGSQG